MTEKKLNLRLTDAELEKLRALAEDDDRSANTYMRRLIAAAYAARFGSKTQTAKRSARA
ncbi:MAG: hypothetical protein KF850_34395 [Labilithrix sp.]|nr:hypothetical protein [Labilithrix sp.]MBX3217171.1 hypothetical protein [Labilithrix sp.]